MKKFDLILFNGEEILDLRIKLMYYKIDYFVIVEFDRTFQCKKKPYFFDINNYKEYKNKIIHHKYKLPKYLYNKSPWHIEAYQRNSLIKNLNIKDRDMIILSDVDEIIIPSKLIFNYNQITRYELLNLRFFGNYLNFTNPYWPLPLSTSFNVAKDIGLEALRASYRGLKPSIIYEIYRQYLKNRRQKLIGNAGWHFSSLKSSKLSISETIQKKINDYSHTEHKNKIIMKTNLITFRIRYGLDVNGHNHLWGTLSQKIIHNKLVNNWIKEKKLFCPKKNFLIKPNYKRIFPYPSKFLRKLIFLINSSIYYLFYIEYFFNKIKKVFKS
jgi:hypothetical protein